MNPNTDPEFFLWTRICPDPDFWEIEGKKYKMFGKQRHNLFLGLYWRAIKASVEASSFLDPDSKSTDPIE